MSTTSSTRPNPTTMEGMIWNANHVLESAVKPSIKGMPKGLFDKCVGIVFVNTVKVGLIFSGTVGSGIALRKTENGWSPPCAVGLSNLGFGILAGVSVSDLIIFVFDEESMKALVADKGMTLGTNIELTVGLGREANLTDTFAGKDKVGATFAMLTRKVHSVAFRRKVASLPLAIPATTSSTAPSHLGRTSSSSRNRSGSLNTNRLC